LSAKAELLLSN